MQNPQSARVPQLDGIRGIAIILVMIWHYAFGFWLDVPFAPERGTVPSLILHALSFSWSGVDLFFVLSGYLIGGILLDNRDASNYFSVFYIRRAFRILPLYYLVLAAGLAIHQGPIATDSHFPPIGWYLLISQNIFMVIHDNWSTWLGHAWSLCVEEQFYLCLPLLLWLVPRTQVRTMSIIFIVAAFVLRCIAVYLGVRSLAITLSFPTRMDSLFIGVICADLHRDPRIRPWLMKNQSVLYSALGVFGLAVALMLAKGMTVGTAAMNTFGYTVLAIFYACFLLTAVIDENGPIARLTRLWLLRKMGTLAYFIFLVHYFVPLYLFKALGWEFSPSSPVDWGLLFASAVLVTMAAELSWRFIERPLVLFSQRNARYQTPSVGELKLVDDQRDRVGVNAIS